MGNATAGLAVIGTYVGVVDTDIAELLALVPDPDAAHGTGAVAGGGFLDEMSPGAAAQLRVELDAINTAVDASGGADGIFITHTVTAGEDTANQADIVTGLADITLANCAISIVRSGSVIYSDQVVTEPSAGTIRVADGGATYVLTAGDIINIYARP